MWAPSRSRIGVSQNRPVSEPTPEQTADDTDVGWGDESAEEKAKRDAEWYARETPPHHGD
jgi:hypothetical protein